MYKSRFSDICHKEVRILGLIAGVPKGFNSKPDIICLGFLLVLMLSACAATESNEARPAFTPVASLAPVESAPVAATATVAVQPSTSPTQETCSPASRESGTVGVGLLDKPMEYHVLLPACYMERSDQRYPVLYLLHGQNATQEQWLNLGISQAAEQLMLAGKIPPFLIVLPFDHSFKQPRDYRFEEVFLEHLIAEIDGTYRTLPARPARAIGGLSRGGAWAIYLVSRHPDVFGVVGAHSPAVFYSNNSALPVRLRDIPAEIRPVFYVDAGDQDVDFREIQKFTALLNELGLSHEWHYNLGFHDEKYWGSHVEEYLLWYGKQFSALE
jgi:enterochelin esterase-like enzyme